MNFKARLVLPPENATWFIKGMHYAPRAMVYTLIFAFITPITFYLPAVRLFIDLLLVYRQAI